MKKQYIFYTLQLEYIFPLDVEFEWTGIIFNSYKELIKYLHKITTDWSNPKDIFNHLSFSGNETQLKVDDEGAFIPLYFISVWDGKQQWIADYEAIARDVSRYSKKYRIRYLYHRKKRWTKKHSSWKETKCRKQYMKHWQQRKEANIV